MPPSTPSAGGGIERTRKTSLTKRASTKVRHLLQVNFMLAKHPTSNLVIHSVTRHEERVPV